MDNLRFLNSLGMTEEQKEHLRSYGFAHYALSLDPDNQSALICCQHAELCLHAVRLYPFYDRVHDLYRCVSVEG